jgi:hypothetical protein
MRAMLLSVAAASRKPEKATAVRDQERRAENYHCQLPRPHNLIAFSEASYRNLLGARLEAGYLYNSGTRDSTVLSSPPASRSLA